MAPEHCVHESDKVFPPFSLQFLCNNFLYLIKNITSLYCVNISDVISKMCWGWGQELSLTSNKHNI